MTATVRPLRSVLASGAKASRQSLNLRQEDAAIRLRRLGLSTWLRGTVAQVEVGARRVTFEELLILALAYETSVAELLEGRPGELVEITPEACLDLAAVRGLLSGRRASLEAIGPAEDTTGIGEAERTAARRLHWPVEEVVARSLAQWGRTLSEERDSRVAERKPDVPTNQVQALRGHVTRQLVAELLAAPPSSPPPAKGGVRRARR